MAAVCALQPIPIRIPHASRRNRKHVLKTYFYARRAGLDS